MRKRILSALLALCMVLTMAPAAFAADVTVSTAEELATAIENAADGETVTLSGDVDLASSYITFEQQIAKSSLIWVVISLQKAAALMESLFWLRPEH